MRASAMSSVPAMSRQRSECFEEATVVHGGDCRGAAWECQRILQGSGRFYSGKDGFGLDLDAPLRVEELFDGDHGGGGADVGEDLAVGAADLLPVFGVGEVHARADDVLEARRRLCGARSR